MIPIRRCCNASGPLRGWAAIESNHQETRYVRLHRLFRRAGAIDVLKNSVFAPRRLRFLKTIAVFKKKFQLHARVVVSFFDKGVCLSDGEIQEGFES